MDYITKPLSRITIRKFSKIVRKIFGCKSDDEPFPVLEALEMLPDIVENTNYEMICLPISLHNVTRNPKAAL